MAAGSPSALVDVLCFHQVDFVVIGGHAVIYHGYVRSTEDLDIVFRRTRQGEKRLLRALDDLEAWWIGNEIDPATGIEKTHRVSASYVASTSLMMLGTRLGYLDVFDYPPGVPEIEMDQLFECADRSSGMPVVSFEHLKALKKASARPKDLEDLRNLQ